MHITYQKLSCDIFMVGNVQNIFMEHLYYFWHNFDPYNALLAITTNIPMLLMTGFVVQGHILFHILNPHTFLIHVFIVCVYFKKTCTK